VPSSAKSLEFSYLGFVSQNVAIGSKTAINIALVTDATQLSEIVVTGYGTQRRADFTGSQASVKAADIANTPILSPEQALQGRAAGVQVTQSSGTPGGGISIRIRGTSSIGASSQPLYVVDGVPISTGSYTQVAAGGQLSNALSDINPNDIESFTILKDASATAIYGSRASNGVILITTKKGGKKLSVDYNFQYGSGKKFNDIDVFSLEGGKTSSFFYKKFDEKFILKSFGPDKKLNTKDDIFPDLK
jgi:TonB-dependent SusC/RagA subfamily outer membrane receptor